LTGSSWGGLQIEKLGFSEQKLEFECWTGFLEAVTGHFGPDHGIGIIAIGITSVYKHLRTIALNLDVQYE
jgi:hypothetical protein